VVSAGTSTSGTMILLGLLRSVLLGPLILVLCPGNLVTQAVVTEGGNHSSGASSLASAQSLLHLVELGHRRGQVGYRLHRDLYQCGDGFRSVSILLKYSEKNSSFLAL